MASISTSRQVKRFSRFFVFLTFITVFVCARSWPALFRKGKKTKDELQHVADLHNLFPELNLLNHEDSQHFPQFNFPSKEDRFLEEWNTKDDQLDSACNSMQWLFLEVWFLEGLSCGVSFSVALGIQDCVSLQHMQCLHHFAMAGPALCFHQFSTPEDSFDGVALVS